MDKLIFVGPIKLTGDIFDEDVKKRYSGNGVFLAPTTEQVGKTVIVTRRCITWAGSLGFFEENPDVKYAFYEEELQTMGEIVPLSQFGKDHWSLLGYIYTLCTDAQGSIGKIAFEKVRCNESRHSDQLSKYHKGMYAHPWQDSYGTRLKEGTIAWHDDWDCLNDLVACGLVVIIHPYKKGRISLTEKGMKMASQLMTHKAKGGTFATFTPPGMIK